MSIQRQFTFLLFFVFVGLGAHATEREYRNIDEFLSVQALGKAVVEVLEGDLNGDGLSDRAILFHPEDAVESKIYVLLQTPKGSFYLAQESKTADFPAGRSLTIKNGSLYVALDAIKNLDQSTHQFKLYQGSWRLIGLTRRVYDPDVNSRVGVETIDTSYNLLTGDVILKRKGRIKHGKETHAPCLLAEYDFNPEFCMPHWGR